MDYSKLSDLEINKRVARYCLGGRAFGVVDGRVETFGGTFDPCNNAADAWPIIMKNKIALYPRKDGGWIAQGFENCVAIIDSNPLRAAMIVFLMMQGDE